MTLIEPPQGEPIPNVDVPQEFYWVLAHPAPLAGMKYPRRTFPWLALHRAGFRKVVALQPGTYDPAPLSVLCAEWLEDLSHGGPPGDPEDEHRKIAEAVAATVKALRDGTGIVVHCKGGRGRTGAVLGCVLRELGYGADQVTGWLDRLHKARGKSGWPESEWQADLVQRWGALDG